MNSEAEKLSLLFQRADAHSGVAFNKERSDEIATTVLKMVEAKMIHHDEREEAWRQRWLAERQEAFTRVASHKDHQTIAAWESMEAEIDAEIIRRRNHIPSLSEDEQRVIALLRDTDLMVREVYEFDMRPGTVRDDFTAHCLFIANALERLLNANRSA